MGNRALGSKRPVARDVSIRLREVSYRHGYLRLSLVERDLERTRIDLIHELALFNKKAILVILLDQIPLDSWCNLGVIWTVELGYPLLVDGDVSLYYVSNFDLGRSHLGSFLFFLAPVKREGNQTDAC